MSAALDRRSLLALAALALVVRAWGVTSQNLWFDEIITVQTAQTPIAILLDPPPGTLVQPTTWLSSLYFALLKVWLLGVPGPTDAVARWSSVLIGVAGVLAIAAAVAAAEGSVVGSIAGVVVALSPFHVWYSQEVRPYGLLLALGAMAIASLYRAEVTPDRRRWWGFVGPTVLASYVHPMAVVVPALAVSIALVDRVWRDRARLWWWVSALAATAIGMLPAGAIIGLRGGNAVPDPRGIGMLDLAFVPYAFTAGFSYGPSLTALHDDAGAALGATWPQVAVLGVAFGLLVLTGVGRTSNWHRLALGFLVPLLVPSVLAVLSGNPLNVRYAILSYPAYVMAVALGVRRFYTARQAWMAAVLAVAVGATGWSLWSLQADPGFAKEDCRSVGRLLATEAGAEDLIVVNATYMERAVDYYYDGPAKVFGVPPGPGADDPALVAEILAAAVARRTTVWLVLTRTFHGDRTGVLAGLLGPTFEPGTRWSFPGVSVQRFARR